MNSTKNTKILICVIFTAAIAVFSGYKSARLISSVGTPATLAELASLEFTSESPTKLPDFAHYRSVQDKKLDFFSYLIPQVNEVNRQVAAQRQTLESLSTINPESLSKEQRRWIRDIAKIYRVKIPKQKFTKQFWNQLLTKVQPIPASLVLAQAANESAWGTSRFALEGNNLFGQWCFKKGCGLVPLNRVEGASHEVAYFDSTFDSIASYVTNLNRHASYQGLRAIRQQLLQQGKLPDGLSLANGLRDYSERGMDYVEEIQAMIRVNNLSRFDKVAPDA